MFRLTLVENVVLDLFDQQLLRFEERFHFESDAFEAFELTFLPSLFEHTMTLFRFSNSWLNEVILFDPHKIEHFSAVGYSGPKI